MCVVSAVHDYFAPQIDEIPWTLGKYKLYQDLINKATEVDEALEQPHCESPEKAAYVKQLEEAITKLKKAKDLERTQLADIRDPTQRLVNTIGEVSSEGAKQRLPGAVHIRWDTDKHLLYATYVFSANLTVSAKDVAEVIQDTIESVKRVGEFLDYVLADINIDKLRFSDSHGYENDTRVVLAFSDHSAKTK